MATKAATGPVFFYRDVGLNPCERYDIPETTHDWRGVDDAGLRRAIQELRAWFDRECHGEANQHTLKASCLHEGRQVDRWVSARRELRARGLA